MDPSPEVLAEFGAGASTAPLAGGQETSWRSGDVILKPLDMPAEAVSWLDQVLRPRCDQLRLRVSLPL